MSDAFPTSEASEHGLFPSDPGVLPDDTRRLLLQLLRGPYVLERTHPRAWAVLARDEQVVRSRLADLFVDLVIDRDLGVAFARNFEVDGVELPRVLRAMSLTLVDTALVLHLREALLRSTDPSRRVFVGVDEMTDWLAGYRPATSTDVVTFGKRVTASMQKMKDNSILLGTQEADRFEISPVLALVFGVDEVVAVTQALRGLIGRADDGVEESDEEVEA